MGVIRTGIREIKSAGTKEKIYKCAELLIRKYCPDNVSLNSITSHAGVSKGSFYLHYDSKDSLEADFITEYNWQEEFQLGNCYCR